MAEHRMADVNGIQLHIAVRVRRQGPRAPVVLEGRGHWTQRERPEEVNAAPVPFLGKLRDAAG